ncbi:MAG: hypothetical protein O3A80_05415, partial [bacterium]|nr:hypothetical protein [bacterium]
MILRSKNSYKLKDSPLRLPTASPLAVHLLSQAVQNRHHPEQKQADPRITLSNSVIHEEGKESEDYTIKIKKRQNDKFCLYRSFTQWIVISPHPTFTSISPFAYAFKSNRVTSERESSS